MTKFVIEGLNAADYPNTQLLIFTRSGQLVFEKKVVIMNCRKISGMVVIRLPLSLTTTWWLRESIIIFSLWAALQSKKCRVTFTFIIN